MLFRAVSSLQQVTIMPEHGQTGRNPKVSAYEGDTHDSRGDACATFSSGTALPGVEV
jgi:hypothetical protein